MARIKPLSLNHVKKQNREVFLKFSNAFPDFSNQVPIYAHSLDGMKHIFGMALDMQNSSTIPKKLIEIAIISASYANKCSYCVAHHGSILKGFGLNKKTIADLLSGEPSNLKKIELLVYNYANAVTKNAWAIRDDMFNDLQKHFDDSQIVELTMRIALTGLFNKVNQALQIELEDGFG